MSEGVHLGVLICVLCAINSGFAQILTPPSFNLAKGRAITATSTCGVGISQPELYCHLTGSEGRLDDTESIQIQGQLCDYCDPTSPVRNHSVQFAIDGSERFWQSPPLSRGDEYNEVNIEIPLGQEFYIAYIFIKMAKSPRPGVWALEKSVDFGETWEPWQYFAADNNDCRDFFNTKANQALKSDDQILCVTRFSRIVPLNDGEILVSLTNGRPNAYNFTHAEELKEFMRATNVRIRLLRTRTLLGHLMAVANQDPTVTRRYFYSIRDISIGGRCVCNGHADTCSYLDQFRPNFLVCDCQHNTVGDQCERCDEANGYVQKKWQPARANTPFECEPCQCFGRATSCVYDAEVDANKSSIDIHGFYNGGGVCQNCGFNSTGNNCDKCVPGFYRPFGTPPSVLDMCEPCQCNPQYHINECEEETGRCLCKEGYIGLNCDSCSVGYYGYPNCIPCDCDVNGTDGDVCHVGGGDCPCKENYVGKKCDMCEKGYYEFPECGLCMCDPAGSIDQFCDVDDGQCNCDMNYATRNCSDCAHGYFNFPDCSLCSCDPYGTLEEVCDKTNGECLCKDTFSGERCDSCARGYYAYPDCMSCQCQEPGSTTNICEDKSGQCTCKPNFAGQNCDRCSPGFYKYPDCVPCNCDSYGSYGDSCDQETGQCDCLFNFQGLMCEKCKEGLYNYPNCEECNCNPAGAKQVPGYPLGGCGGVAIGLLCECKAKVTGRICDACQPGYWNLNRNNPDGCEGCSCSDAGTIGMNVCNMITGQCMCKVDVTGRNCDTCQDGYYGLHKQNLYGCIECDCDIGGSESLVCDKETGQCPCKPRVQGRRCDQSIQQHFIPTLDQLRYEIEDGYTPEGHPVRYGFDERLFPNFSWKGYAILTPLQNEVRMDVDIYKPSIYRVIYRYVNLNEEAVTGTVKWSMADGGVEEEQTGMLKFEPSSDPAFGSLSNLGGNFGYVLNPGRWTMSVTTDENVFLDYMILIPQAYFEATVLQTRVFRPCVTPDDEGPCLHYTYPEVLDFPRVTGDSGYVMDDNDSRVPVDLFDNDGVLTELDIDSMAILNPDQSSFYMNLYIPKTDKYVLVLNYYSDANDTQNLLFNIGDDHQATAVIYNCQYSSLCRQVLLGLDEMEGVFEMEEGYHTVKVTGEDDINAGIESIVAIPYHIWTIRYIRPSIVCIRINGVCVGSRYATPIGSIKIEFEALPNDHLISTWLPPNVNDPNIGLVLLNSTQNLIVLLGQARNPGLHKFLVHYYLPYDTGSEMSVVLYANGQEYKGVFRPRFCPGVNGCRDLIYFEDFGLSGDLNLLNLDVKVEFNNTSGQDIWMDYLLLIPSGQYTPNNIVLQPVDNSQNFIDVCLDDGYEVKTPISDFCENSLFTLTTEFNNGALECECNIDGSLNFNCEPYGGQCTCRPNVIGRTCSACRVGYYGFPRCQPCNCPFGLCHELTGQCICPPRVTGDRCDVCQPGTYGYDALIGCQECSCNVNGVIGSDLNCDEDTGQCSCLEGIGGRKCDFCIAGYYGFPQCRQCECDRQGTTEDICNADTAQCLCKENVMGVRCDQCMPFTYNLDMDHPKGCTSCFCFGNTAKCEPSTLPWDEINEMMGWNLTNMVDGVDIREAGNVVAIVDALDTTANTSRSMYWIAPQEYLGNKITSYGGFLLYQVLFVLPRNDSILTESLVGEPDVILKGNGNTIVYRSPTVPYNNIVTDMEVQLSEYNFVHADTGYPGLPVDRETMMMVLVNLEALHIRGSYYSVVDQLRLMSVVLEHASEMGLGKQANTVEECSCPRGYEGTSCETCTEGYYRARTYPHLGVCLPCECNGHAETCDMNTGECLNCANNTMGPHCEYCLTGYLGSGYLNQETTNGCNICGCPLPIDSNNFADACQLQYTSYGDIGLFCDCFDGYEGDICERCSPGYFGDPMVEGDSCQPCDCSGNIDMTDPDSCDYQTGACLKCINNSTGLKCDRCRDWWYGEAVGNKDCYPCSCSKCGSVSCNNQQGQCLCKPNVIGINCDSCAPDTYGFDLCEGCRHCECAEASVDSQCDMYNGSCSCQPGVTGQKCESCIGGYWNYQEAGCEKCACDFEGAVTCNPLDGSCQCLPGVTGDMCESCLDRWVLIPQEGCRECDTCTHHLLDDLDFLLHNITVVQDGLQTVSIGVYAMQRLDTANNSVIMYQPMVTALLNDKENITLEPVEKEIEQWSTVTNNILVRTTTSMNNAESITEDSGTLIGKGEEAEKLGMESENKAKEAILYIKDILRQINEGIQVTNIETYITLSEQIMEKIRMTNYTMQNESVADELEEAEMLLAKVLGQQMLPKEQMIGTKHTEIALQDIEDHLLDLQQNSQTSEATTTSAMAIIDKLNEDTMMSIDSHLGGIEVGEEMTYETIDSAEELLQNGYSNFNDSVKEFKSLDGTSARMGQAKAVMIQFGKKYVNLERAASYVNDSWDHANALQFDAELLDNTYTNTRDLASNAVDAGRAYETIVFALETARAAAQMAVLTANATLEQSQGLADGTKKVAKNSEMLLTSAITIYNSTEIQLVGRLEHAKSGTEQMSELNKDVRKASNQLDMNLQRIAIGRAENQSEAVEVKSEMAVNEAEESVGDVQGILDGLPQELEKTGPLVTNVINFGKDISLAKTQLNNVQKSIPEITKLLADVKDQSEQVKGLGRQVTTSLQALREKIAIARNKANLIRVGLKFLGNTTATLRNPPYVAQAGSYSKVSLFFKTESENGLLLYAGSPRSGTGQANRDYMAVEIENGNVVFKYNLGNGLARLNHPHYVADGKWYKVTAKRIGKAGTLTLERDPSEQPQLEPVYGKATGLSSVLEMHPLTTKFYVGGLPAGVTISDDVTRAYYMGVMESVEFDDMPMGLWNFETAENNHVGARERNILTSIFSNGFRFDGSGYVIVSTSAAGWKPAVKSQVALRMKTYAENGLLFYAGDGKRDFLSIEVKMGKILFQYDLGGGRIELRSDAHVNDGEWHDIRVSRLNKTGVMNVDEEQVGPLDAPGSLTQLSISDDISVGGYQHVILPTTGVTKKGFEGCIEDLTLQLTTWDLNNNKKSKGVIPGCPEQIARVATFSADQLSYVAKPMDSIGANFDLTFKMKTKKNTSLVLFAGHSAQDVGFSVSLVNGMIAVVSDNGEEKIELMSRVNTYSDGRWHYISIMKMGLKLMMNIDDYEIVQDEGEGTQKKLETDKPLYFGTPDTVPKGVVPTTEAFDGCIGDVTINGEFLNFASIPASARSGAALSGCPIPDPEGPYERQQLTTLYPPFEWPSTTTTLAPVMEKDKCALESSMPRELNPDELKGLYYGAYPNSRTEYTSLPASLRIKSAFSMDFRTTASDGVIFYFADRKDLDHISIAMKDGKIRYTYNSGTGMGIIVSPDAYNDGAWHMLEIGRTLREGVMQIDGNVIETTNSRGRARSINGRAPYYFGGVNANALTKNGKTNLDNILNSFTGCLANIKLNGIDIGEAPVQNGTIPCSDVTETGAYFYDDGGYIQIIDSFNVGQDLTVELEIKPRTMDGVLFSVHGSKGDFVLLQMMEGQLQFRADNGAGAIIADYVPEMKSKLCDGMWHKIVAVKNKNVVFLTVDTNEAIKTVSSGSASSTDTKNPVYLGGKPDAITKGVRAKGKYLGCMRNLVINGNPQFLTTGVAFDSVDVNSCPVD